MSRQGVDCPNARLTTLPVGVPMLQTRSAQQPRTWDFRCLTCKRNQPGSLPFPLYGALGRNRGGPLLDRTAVHAQFLKPPEIQRRPRIADVDSWLRPVRQVIMRKYHHKSIKRREQAYIPFEEAGCTTPVIPS